MNQQKVYHLWFGRRSQLGLVEPLHPHLVHKLMLFLCALTMAMSLDWAAPTTASFPSFSSTPASIAS